MNDTRIGFIGGGNMSLAIAGGLIASGVPANRIIVAEPQKKQREYLAEQLDGITIEENNSVAAAAVDCLVLATKPQVLADVCHELAAVVQENKPLIVSIAAGVRASDIDTWLGGDLPVVRVMPNQPALLRQGVSGLYANSRSSSADRESASNIMSAVGEVVWVDNESDIDAVTAISGSGPAYFFLLIDMLIKTATDMGLDASAARKLAVETAAGAAALATHTSDDMGDLIARVRSPGGTTAAALDRLEEQDVRAIFSTALIAARNRAFELANEANN